VTPPGNYVVVPRDDGQVECFPGWYSINGLAVYTPAYTLCNTCQEVYWGGGACGTAVPDGGVTWTWGGTAVDGCATYTTCSNTCDMNEGALSCGTAVCVAAGRYTAKLCTEAGQCLSIPFDYPATGEVVGTISAPDAGLDSGS
jgi:hypothetical protein